MKGKAMKHLKRDVPTTIDWLKDQAKHGPANWKGLCLKSARSAWGLPVVAPSARIWWERVVPDRYKHHAISASHVPAGAMCYAPLGKWGHAWVMSYHGHAYSTDYRRRGHIDWVADGALQHWTHTRSVWWTDWTPQGLLPLKH